MEFLLKILTRRLCPSQTETGQTGRSLRLCDMSEVKDSVLSCKIKWALTLDAWYLTSLTTAFLKTGLFYEACSVIASNIFCLLETVEVTVEASTAENIS